MEEATQKKRKVRRTRPTSNNGLYCRKCMTYQNKGNFYSSPDKFLDSNGLLSVCKTCVSDIVHGFYISNNNSLSMAIFHTCKTLNFLYFDEHIGKLEDDFDNDFTTIFGKYIRSTAPYDIQDKTFSYEASSVSPTVGMAQEIYEGNDENKKELMFEWVKKWGDGWEFEDYAWLDNRLSEWKKSHKCDTTSEESLMQQIVWKEFDIYRTRRGQGDTTKDTKQLLDLIKTAALDPSSQSSANSGKGYDTFGMFIKQIEENEPAEFYKDKKLYQDIDKIKYVKNFIVRAIKNFMTGSRDFEINLDEDDGDDDEELNVEQYLEDVGES